MNGIKYNFRVHNFNVEFQIEKRLSNGSQLSHCVVGKTSALASVMQMKSLLGFVVAKVRGSTKTETKMKMKRHPISHRNYIRKYGLLVVCL